MLPPMLTQLKVQLKLLFSNKTALLAMVAMPLVLTYLLTKVNAGGTQYTVYVSDADRSTASAQYISLLKNQADFKIVETSAESVDNALAGQKTDAAVKIDKGFSKSVAAGSAEKMQVLQSYQSADSMLCTQEITQCYNVLLQADRGAAAAAFELTNRGSTSQAADTIVSNALKANETTAGVTSESFSLNGSTADKADPAADTLMGFLILFMGIIVIQGCRTLIDEKENRTYERMLGTPASFLKVLTVKTVSLFLYSAANVAVVIAAGRLLFHLEVFRNLLPLCLVFAAYLFAMIGITLLFTLRANNQQMFTAVGLPAAVVTGMLGGCFFPIDIAPKAIQTISRFTPQGWALPAVNSLNAVDSAPTVFTACMVLTAAGIVFLTVFFLIHRYRLKLMSK